MLKKFVFVAVSMVLTAQSVMANDDLAAMVANLDGAKDKSSQVENADLLGQDDVDALMGEKKQDGQDAVAACFRRSGYGGGHGSYSNYNSYSNYGCYNNYSYCAPSYSYNCYSPSYCYTPTTYSCYTPSTYSCYTPVSYCAPVSYNSCYSPCYTSYWGCW